MKKEIKFLAISFVVGVIFIGSTAPSFTEAARKNETQKGRRTVNKDEYSEVYAKAKAGDEQAIKQVEALESVKKYEDNREEREIQQRKDKQVQELLTIVLKSLDEPLVGMSLDELITTFGQPKKANKTVTSNVVHYQLSYGNGRYVYVDNGVVTAYQGSGYINIMK